MKREYCLHGISRVFTAIPCTYCQVFGMNDPDAIRDGASRLFGGFVGMAAGSGIIYFIAVS